MPEETEKQFDVRQQSRRFEVIDSSAKVIMACQDEGSATHYAVLLNEAYQQGYKAGYRDGRRSRDQ